MLSKNLMKKGGGLNCVPSEFILTKTMLTPVPQTVTVSRDKVFKEVIKIKKVIKAGPSLTWLVSLEEEIRIHTHTCGNTMCRHSKKRAIYKPRREASTATNPADSFILNFWSLEPRENKFLLFKLPSLWFFVLAALTH